MLQAHGTHYDYFFFIVNVPCFNTSLESVTKLLTLVSKPWWSSASIWWVKANTQMTNTHGIIQSRKSRTPSSSKGFMKNLKSIQRDTKGRLAEQCSSEFALITFSVRVSFRSHLVCWLGEVIASFSIRLYKVNIISNVRERLRSTLQWPWKVILALTAWRLLPWAVNLIIVPHWTGFIVLGDHNSFQFYNVITTS